jgi:tripartite motif-containing protein 2/3
MLLAVCLMVLGGGLGVFSVPAFAAGEFALGSSFGKEGEGPGEFKEPANVAVQSSTGDVFVADPGNHRVQVFKAGGEYVAQIEGDGESGAFGEVRGVAVDDSNGSSAGDVYIADTSNGV